MNKIKKITIDLIDEDYNPLEVFTDEGSTIQGGGDIYTAVIGVIGEAIDDEPVKYIFDSLDDEIRDRLAEKIRKAYKEVSKEVGKIFNIIKE